MKTLKEGYERMKKLFGSKKALSPVVAAIILIAVTVAVSIAVAAWMGALTFGFMGGAEQLEVGTPWGWTSNSVQVPVTNNGGSSVTISKARVNNTEIDIDRTIPPGESENIEISLEGKGWTFKDDYSYTIILITSNGKEFPTTGKCDLS